MEPERELSRVHGLGRGSLLGFSLILTDQAIVGIDSRKRSLRLWLAAILGLGVGIFFFLLILFSGLEPALFKISPLLSFVTMLALVFSLPLLMFALVPRFLRKRMERSGYSTMRAPKKDILSIETRRPSKVTEKGYFTVKLADGASFTFWTVGKDMFDYVNSALTNFAPRQIRDASISIGESIDVALDKPSNKLLTAIIASLILLVLISGTILSPYVSLAELIGVLTGIIVIHLITAIAYIVLRRFRRHPIEEDSNSFRVSK